MAKYSKEQRRCAVELYVRYECCAADMCVLASWRPLCERCFSAV